MLMYKCKKWLSLLMMSGAVALTGCGGGGGASGSSGGAGGGTTSTGTPTVTLTMTATPGGGAAINSISSGSATYLNATVKGSNGAVVSGAVVTFTIPDDLAKLTPSSGTALTNSSGVASIQIDAKDTSSAGAGVATASATWAANGQTVTADSAALGFAVGSATVSFGQMTVSPSSISAYGSSTVSLPVLINGALATVPINVMFTSGCVGTGKSTIQSPVTTVNGVATVSYKDTASCASTDTITASVSGTSATATASIVVAAPVANNIQFTSAEPSVIGITGTGLPTSSVVKFKVVDANNNGVAGKVVDFSVTPELAAGSVSMSASQATSDSTGSVSVSLTAGTVPTPVWVVAKLNATPSIKSQSTALTVTTGLPTQNFLSLSASTHNLEGWGYDGVESTVTAIASDRLGNPVPDGTAINFVTEGGQMQGGTEGKGTCKTSSGSCSVTLRSAEFRPADGRVTILAYVVGEKSFVDGNSNNTWDAGETFYDLGDPFIDNNENGTFDAGEQSWSYASGSSACGAHLNGAAAVSAYPSNYASILSKSMTCSGTMSGNSIRAYVRKSDVMVFSGSNVMNAEPTAFDMKDGDGNYTCNKSFSIRISDVNDNPMPKGTVLSVENADVTYIKSDGKYDNAIAKVNLSEVWDTTAKGGTTHVFSVSAARDECPGADPQPHPHGTFNLAVTTPKGNVTLIPITITGKNPPVAVPGP